MCRVTCQRSTNRFVVTELRVESSFLIFNLMIFPLYHTFIVVWHLAIPGLKLNLKCRIKENNIYELSHFYLSS